MSEDPRSRRIAVVADSLLEERFDELRDTGWGVVQLPPAELDPETARDWLELAAEQIAEYERTGHELVLLDDGGWAEALGRALRELGASPLEGSDPLLTAGIEPAVSRPSNRRRRAN